MADNAAQETLTTSPNAPRRWWQWILIYPALGISLLTAAPLWIDKYRLYSEGINKPSVVDAEKQTQLWRKNLSCSASPFSWYNNPSNIKVDATICDSGDIFVRAATPDNGQYFRWLPIDEVVQKPEVASKGVVPTANAATLSEAPTAASNARSKPLFKLAQVNATVICQKFLDDRRLLRRVQTPQGCFDEIIDTYNGAVVERNPAPCTPQC